MGDEDLWIFFLAVFDFFFFLNSEQVFIRKKMRFLFFSDGGWELMGSFDLIEKVLPETAGGNKVH